MDILTVLCSSTLSATVSIVLLIVFYKFWILPYLTQITNSIPASVKDLVFPFVDGKMAEIKHEITENVEAVSKSVKMSSARFQRTVRQAMDSLDLDDVDLESEDGIQTVQDKLSKKYGMDVAVNAITQLIQSIEGRKKAEESNKGVSTW